MNDELPSSKAIVWRRWLAAAADWVVILLCVIVIAAAVGAFVNLESWATVGLIALHVVVGFSYFTLLEHRLGQSPGKRVLGLRVVTADDALPGWARAAGRAAFAWVAPTLLSDLLLWQLDPLAAASGFGIRAVFAGLTGPAAVLFLPARGQNGYQAWHDRWTGTRVIAVGPKPARLVAASMSLAFFSLVLLPLTVPSQTYRIYPPFVLLATTAGVALVLALTARRLILIVFAGTTLALVVVAILAFLPPQCCPPAASAIGSLRAIGSAQSTYAASCADGGYAIDLADLATGPQGGSPFISPDLGKNGVVNKGYIFTVSRENSPAVQDVGSPEKTCNGARGQPVSSYFVSANPVSKEVGAVYFATDSRGTIFSSTLGPIPNPIPPDATPIQ